MTENLEIRDSVSADFGAIESLYPDAFPDEDLLPLVRDLLPDTMVATSIVGEIDARIVGHVILTKCGVTGERANAALVGPLAVTPARQGHGIGSALVLGSHRICAIRGQRIRESCLSLNSGDSRPYGFLDAAASG